MFLGTYPYVNGTLQSVTEAQGSHTPPTGNTSHVSLVARGPWLRQDSTATHRSPTHACFTG
ncbi:hypothetical protein E2C01_001738 [Portunus trituberculatus]|uniref:Uncharacterized protein n=1 Tax=Portunus trituberculatus TaxID=210409 RepID=A0A5B7CIP7_PORTR|nr:hypothetical protein [Portunus trituberculatus]